MRITLAASVDLALVLKLDESVKLKRVNRSAIVSAALQHFLSEHIADAVLVENHFGNKSDRDGNDAVARAFIKDHMTWKVNALVKGLVALGIDRKKTWVTEVRLAIRGCDSTLTE